MLLTIRIIPQQFQVNFTEDFLSMAGAVTVRLLTCNNQRLPKLYQSPV